MSDLHVLLIDLSSLYWTAWHASGNDSVSQARITTLNAVQRCRGNAPEGAAVAVCCDMGRSFRKAMLPAYKANRPEKDHLALGEMDKTRERLRADGYLLWGSDGFEADDVIATATEKAVAAGVGVTIASSDKDLLQLIRPGVTALRTHDWTIWDFAKVEEKFGVGPALLGDWLALVGDKSDNILGAPGIGPKTATALLNEHGSLRGIFTALFSNGGDGFKPSVKESLTQNSQNVDLARKLVALRTDAPIEFGDLWKPRAPLRLVTEQPPTGDDMDNDDDGLIDAPPPKPAAAPPRLVTPPPEATPAPAPAPTTAHVEHAKTTAADMSAEPTTSALVPASYVSPSFEMQLEPTSIGTAYKMARGLYESRLYQRYQTVEAIWAVIIRGREMGLGALTALDSFHVVEGKPTPHAMLIIARAKAHPDCEYFMCIETSATACTWETKNRRNPKPTRLTYTLEQAQAAGLVKPGSNWTKRPDEMIRKTAGVQLARIEYPEVALGLYAVEESDAA